MRSKANVVEVHLLEHLHNSTAAEQLLAGVQKHKPANLRACNIFLQRRRSAEQQFQPDSAARLQDVRILQVTSRLPVGSIVPRKATIPTGFFDMEACSEIS